MRSLRRIVSVLAVLAWAGLLSASCASPDASVNTRDVALGEEPTEERAAMDSAALVLARPHPRCGHPGLYASCREDLQQAPCLAAHGRWGKWGLGPQDSCLCPTGDAGCPCNRAGDCEGMCLGPRGVDCKTATQGTCSADRTVFGCFCYFDAEGRPGTICVD